MNTCDTCDHWSKKTVGEEDDMERTAYDPQRRCSLLGDGDYLLPMCLGAVGMVDITTHAKFGCVHHTKIEGDRYVAPKKPEGALNWKALGLPDPKQGSES